MKHRPSKLSPARSPAALAAPLILASGLSASSLAAPALLATPISPPPGKKPARKKPARSPKTKLVRGPTASGRPGPRKRVKHSAREATGPEQAKATARKAASKMPAARNTARRVKGSLLWIGDAAVPTGFATVTHEILAQLHPRWDITVSGVNYDGRAHSHPYRIQPAWQGEDMWGLSRFAHLCAEFAPDAVVINSDWWNVAAFLDRAPQGLPIVAYMPVDGANMDPAIARKLSALDAAVWYTDFGFREAARAGFSGARQVIPHGIDTALFRPVDRALAREALGLPERAFIVGNVNRNQPRKRLDVTLRCFAEWTRRHRVSDAFLLLHCAKHDTGWDLASLAAWHGIADRVIFTGCDDLRDAADAGRMPLIYSALDVQISTTLGEGWGLTTMEGMACGVPQIVPAWAALGEWAGPAVKIPCSTQLAHPEINTIGALPDMEVLIGALHSLYRDPSRRAALGSECARFVRADAFRWENVARAMESVIESVILRPARGAPERVAVAVAR